jgi:anti-sigma factor RsiW
MATDPDHRPGAGPCAQWRYEAAIYVLGALGPAERQAFERHFHACPQCRAEVLAVAPLPGLLRRMSPDPPPA